MAESFHKKIYFELAKAPECFSLFLTPFWCFALRVSFSQPQKREFFQIKRACENTNLARRKKFFSSSLLSGAEREREREKAEQRSRENKRRKENETREPPEYSSSLFSSE